MLAEKPQRRPAETADGLAAAAVSAEAAPATPEPGSALPSGAGPRPVPAATSPVPAGAEAPTSEPKPLAAALRGASVRFGSFTAIDKLDLEIEAGGFYTILGPSGCGKSTMLRLVSDLIPAAAGEVEIFGKTTEQARLAREFAFVFQDATLLPWRSALKNVELPLEIGRRRGIELPVGSRSPRELLELVGLKGREDALPHEMSGGMRQRVAIARALVCQPKLLLMDEPFGALDEMTRDRLNLQLLDIWRETGTTILFVTHSIAEAVFLGQKVVMLQAHPGRLREVVDIDLPDPRTIKQRDTQAFTAYCGRLRDLLETC